MTKKLIITLLFIGCSMFSFSQNVVKWSYSVKKITDNTFEIHFTPKIQSGWHIYSLKTVGEMGSPTSFSFEKNPDFELMGEIFEDGMQKDFIQKLVLIRDTTIHLIGRISFMACTKEICMPPQTIQFDLKIEGKLPTLKKELLGKIQDIEGNTVSLPILQEQK